MRTFVIVVVTVITTSLLIGFSARILRWRESDTQITAEVQSLRRQVDSISGRLQALVWSEELIRNDLKSLGQAKATVVRDNRDDFLRLLAEDRDNEQMPQLRKDIIHACESAATRRIIDKNLASNCVHVLLSAQEQLLEIRRRVIPPGEGLTSVGYWTFALRSELQRLRSWRLSSLMDMGASERDVRVLLEAVKDIQDLSPAGWR